MAKKPKAPKVPPIPAFDGTPQQALGVLAGKDYPIRDAFLAGDVLGNSYFSEGSLGRVGTNLGEGHGTAMIDPNALNTGELLARYRAESFVGGQRPQDVTDSLSRLSAAGDRSDLTRQLIERRMAGLEGLNAAENAALRDTAQSGINRSFATGLRQLRSQYPGAVGPAASLAARPLIGALGDSQRGLERDILVANVDEKNRRLNELQGLVRTTEQDEYDRRLGYNTALRDQSQFEVSDRANRLDRFSNLQRGVQEDLLKRRLIDMDQLAREKAGKLGLIFGSGSFGAAQQGRRESTDLAREQLSKL